MKCKYCGNNLGLEDEFCPHCGKINEQASKYVSEMKQYREDFDKTKVTVAKKSRLTSRTARVAVIIVMLFVTLIMLLVIRNDSDLEIREKMNRQKTEREVDRYKGEIGDTLKELEENREYLALENYMSNYNLRSNDDFIEYSRVFTAAISYDSIYNEIISIVDGFEGYEETGTEGRCKLIATYVSQWNMYVDGEFWGDPQDSEMHAGEHGAFLKDIKKETQDMVQVYFDLTDDQANKIWDMGEEELGSLLYEKYKDIYWRNK